MFVDIAHILRRRTVIAFLILPAAAAIQAAPARSISVSRQFVVYGPDLKLRGAICELAEQTKQHFLRLIDQRDDWTTPILIDAQPLRANFPEAPKAALTLSQTGGGLKLQLELTIGPDLGAAAIQREILRAIVLEIVYRGQPNLPPGTAYASPPEWLLYGALALTSERDSSPITAALQSAATAKKVLPLEEFLRQRPTLLDGPGQALYRAYAFALVASLTESPAGQHQFAAFVRNLPSSSNDPLADLGKDFPALKATRDELEKNWAASVGRVITARSLQLLNVTETETQLTAILGDKLERIERPKNLQPLRELNRNLILLATHANPLYRPIITDYQRLVFEILRGKNKNLKQRLADLKSLRARVSARMSEIDDYMNWFEATQSKKLSDAFDDYLRAAEQTQENPKRRDRISLYLDTLESQMQN